MEITILGSGTSTGVPEIGCTCKVCTSNDLRDKRLRCSGLVDVNGMRILIDCGPDFREQMIRLDDFRAIDAVLVTHEHYDHVGGLDDLRPFCRFKDVEIYAEEETCERIRRRIPYCFYDNLYPGVPKLVLNNVMPDAPFTIMNDKNETVEIIPIRVMHGKMPILGFRIGNMAWISDMLTLSEEEYDKLKGLDVLVMNALRVQPHNTHQNFEQAIANAKRIAAKNTYFVHMSHQAGLHSEVDKSLPNSIHLAYDGMKIFL